MKSKEKLIKEREQLRLQIKELKVEYEVMKPGSAEEITTGTALASLRLNLCNTQNKIQSVLSKS